MFWDSFNRAAVLRRIRDIGTRVSIRLPLIEVDGVLVSGDDGLTLGDDGFLSGSEIGASEISLIISTG